MKYTILILFFCAIAWAGGGSITGTPNQWNSDSAGIDFTGGSVGIGTASPSTKLHLSSGTLTIDGTAPKIAVTGANNTAVVVTMASGQNNGAQFNFDSSRNLQLNDSVNGGGVRTTGILQLGTADASDIQFAPNGGEAMRIKTTSGNVGIGTTNPQAKLDVVSTTSGLGVPSMTTAQMDAAGGTPARAGIIVYNSTLPAVCVSTGTAQGAYAKILTALTTECR